MIVIKVLVVYLLICVDCDTTVTQEEVYFPSQSTTSNHEVDSHNPKDYRAIPWRGVAKGILPVRKEEENVNCID